MLAKIIEELKFNIFELLNKVYLEIHVFFSLTLEMYRFIFATDMQAHFSGKSRELSNGLENATAPKICLQFGFRKIADFNLYRTPENVLLIGFNNSRW